MRTELVTAPYTGNHITFLSGPPGSGKTTLAVRRLRHLLEEGVPAEQILILVPQRTLSTPYYNALRDTEAPAGGVVDVATIGGLARRTLDLFWPLVAEPAGFGHPDRRPRFLTLETAQYYMDRIVEPFIAGGAFDGVTIPRARLVSQIIDNLNKAAAVGFPADDIAARLKSAWGGESARLRIYDQVQAVALAFRQACLAENLLDWSLQIEVFWHHLLPLPQLRRYLLGGYRHLIVDNAEEDIPATHDLLRIWLSLCESALLIHDTDGGYRVFLGADPEGALSLQDLCRERVILTESHVTTPEMAALGVALAAPFISTPQTAGAASSSQTGKPAREALRHERQRFHPQMLDWVAEEVSRLVLEQQMRPGEIAVLAPFLSDALRFSLTEKLSQYHIPLRTHRPSRQLREEPAARCLMTLVKLAHPSWGRSPAPADVAYALMLAIADLDPVRARLLTDIVYRVEDGRPTLIPFHQIIPETQDRISYLLGGRYDELRRWIEGYVGSTGEPEHLEKLDHFLSRLFGEVLSQPGFGFHRDFDAGAVAANLIESIQKFRRSFSSFAPHPGQASRSRDSLSQGERGEIAQPQPSDLNLEYLDMVERGVVAAQYVSSWQIRPEDAVLLVPAYTFLMMNQPVTVQFWLDAGSRSWFERIYQPLTHPYILRRDWPEGEIWADEDEVRVREEALGRLILGLTRRCRQRVYLAISELNERGYEQQGPLLQAVQRLLRRQGGDAR
ncbi:MAG: AAA family ATPase [Anaerolineae bacterium]|jgi:hypothetical protein